MNEKLHEEILEVLKKYVNNQFQQNALQDQKFKFKYYHTSSDDNAEFEVKVFSVAKGLLARLNSKDSIPNRNLLILYSITYFHVMT